MKLLCSGNCFGSVKPFLKKGLCIFIVITGAELKVYFWDIITSLLIQLTGCHHLNIGSLKVTSRFTVPPKPLHGLFPCDVAKKCHSASTLKSVL